MTYRVASHLASRAGSRNRAQAIDPARSPARIAALAASLVATAILLTALVSPALACKSDVSAMNSWIRMAPPGMKVHAGYMMLQNKSDRTVEITGAESASYKRVEIHASKVIDGIATMEKLAQISLAPGQTVALKPGGVHLMLIGPRFAEQKEGQEIRIALKRSDGSRIELVAPVKATAPGGQQESSDGHHHSHHQHMGH